MEQNIGEQGQKRGDYSANSGWCCSSLVVMESIPAVVLTPSSSNPDRTSRGVSNSSHTKKLYKPLSILLKIPWRGLKRGNSYLTNTTGSHMESFDRYAPLCSSMVHSSLLPPGSPFPIDLRFPSSQLCQDIHLCRSFCAQKAHNKISHRVWKIKPPIS